MIEKTRDETWLIRSAIFTYNYHNTFKPFFVNMFLFVITIILPTVLFWNIIEPTVYAKAFKGYIAGMDVLTFASIYIDLSIKSDQTLDWIDSVFEEIRKTGNETFKCKMQKIHNYKLKMYELRNKAVASRWNKKKIISKACIYITIYNIIFIIVR